MAVIKFMLLASLIKLLLSTDKPILCSGIYAGVAFISGLVFGYPFILVVASTIIGFILATLYFWLLSRFEDAGVIWWVILVGGFFIGLV